MDDHKADEDRNDLDFGDGASWKRVALLSRGRVTSIYLACVKDGSHSIYPSEFVVKTAPLDDSAELQNEEQVLINLGGCLYVIEYYGNDVTTCDKGRMSYNLLLEHISGRTLADFIKKHEGVGLPEAEARQYAWFILRGIHHIHKKHYVHCNIRPECIVLASYVTGRSQFVLVPKITNFGLAKRAYSNKRIPLVSSKWVIPYPAPEIVEADRQEPPSDIWAFGFLVYEMLTGTSLRLSEMAWDSAPEMSRVASLSGRNFLRKCFRRNDVSRFSAEDLFQEDFVSELDIELEELEATLYNEKIGYDEVQDEASSVESNESNCGEHVDYFEFLTRL